MHSRLIAALHRQQTSAMQPHSAEGKQRRAIFLPAEPLAKNRLFLLLLFFFAKKKKSRSGWADITLLGASFPTGCNKLKNRNNKTSC